jgi:hypothetical protein
MALALVRRDEGSSPEDLQTANTRRNHQLAKRSADAGWSAFLSIRTFKAVCAGKRVVALPPVSPG